MENKLSEEPDAPNLKVDLKFKKMDDFEPENVARQVKPLKELLDLRTRLSDLRGTLQGNDKLEEAAARSRGQHREAGEAEGRNGGQGGLVQWLIHSKAQPSAATSEVQERGLLDQIVEEGRFGAEPAARERGKNLVKEFVAQVLEGSMTIAQGRRDDDQRAHRADRSSASPSS